MDCNLKALADLYSKKYAQDYLSKDKLFKAYEKYVIDHQQSILSVAASTMAVNGLFLYDTIDENAVTSQMQEAFDLAFPNLDIAQLEKYDAVALTGIISSWKGKLFEIELRDRLNSGEYIGEIQLGAGQRAELAVDPSQPGWDIQILNADGTVDQVLQAKATESVSYVKEALEKYPDIEIVTTEEVATRWAEDIIDSERSDEELEKEIMAPMKDLLDSGLEDFAELISPWLPVVVIAVTEGKQVMIGKQTLQVALNNSLDRAIKSGASIGVGGLLAMLGAGMLSLPGSLLIQIGLDRWDSQKNVEMTVLRNIQLLNSIMRKRRSA
jgi:hypothetical protein